MVFQAAVMIALAVIIVLLHNIVHNLGIGITRILQAIQQRGSNNDDREKTD